MNKLSTLWERAQETENKKKGRLLFILGFVFALGAYNHKYLWDYSYYHLISFAFVFFIAETWLREKSKVWLIIRGFVLITALNALKDEIIGEGAITKVAEYVAFTIIAMVTAWRIIKLYYK